MSNSISNDLVTRRVFVKDHENYKGIVRDVFHDSTYLKAIVEKEDGELKQCVVTEMKIIRGNKNLP